MSNQLMTTAALRAAAKRRFNIGEIGKRGGFGPPHFCVSVVVIKIADTPYNTYTFCSLSLLSLHQMGTCKNDRWGAELSIWWYAPLRPSKTLDGR